MKQLINSLFFLKFALNILLIGQLAWDHEKITFKNTQKIIIFALFEKIKHQMIEFEPLELHKTVRHVWKA